MVNGASAAPVPPVALTLEASRLPSAWKAGEGCLLLAARAPAEREQRAVVSVTGIGDGALAVGGEVVGVRIVASGLEIAVEPDEEGRALVARILGWLEAGGERPRARAPRHRVAIPATVSSRSGNTYMTTFSLSRGGCGLAWSGPFPRLGDVLWVRLGSAAGGVAMRGMVCWTKGEGDGRRVGIRFVGGQDSELAALLAKARREATGR